MEWGEEDMSHAASTGVVRAARESGELERRGRTSGEVGTCLLPEGDGFLWGGCNWAGSEGQQAFDGLRQEGELGGGGV